MQTQLIKYLIQKTLEMKSNLLAISTPDAIIFIANVPTYSYNKKTTTMLTLLDTHLDYLRKNLEVAQND